MHLLFCEGKGERLKLKLGDMRGVMIAPGLIKILLIPEGK